MIVYDIQMYEKSQVVVSLILYQMNTNCLVCLYVKITIILNDYVLQQ